MALVSLEATTGKMVLLLELVLKVTTLLVMAGILGSSFAAFHVGSPFLLLPLVAAALFGTLMSNLGTDLSPDSCTSGSTSCGTGLLLSRSDSSRTRFSLFRILFVCLLLLLLLSSDSAVAAAGSLYSEGSFRMVELDSVASRRTDSVLVWSRFIWSSWEIEGICSSLVGGLLEELVVALCGRE